MEWLLVNQSRVRGKRRSTPLERRDRRNLWCTGSLSLWGFCAASGTEPGKVWCWHTLGNRALHHDSDFLGAFLNIEGVAAAAHYVKEPCDHFAIPYFWGHARPDISRESVGSKKQDLPHGTTPMRRGFPLLRVGLQGQVGGSCKQKTRGLRGTRTWELRTRWSTVS